MLKIVKDNAPSLREKSKPVPMPLSKETKDLLDQMLSYLRDSQNEDYRAKHKEVREGVGLAAPQIGVNQRMLVISYPYRDGDEIKQLEYQLVNPEIISNSVRKCYLEYGEGCLSVDSPHPGRTYRHFKIVVQAYDALMGKEVTITARGYDAIVLQHEIDHLDGILFYDRIDKTNPEKDIPGAIAI